MICTTKYACFDSDTAQMVSFHSCLEFIKYTRKLEENPDHNPEFIREALNSTNKCDTCKELRQRVKDIRKRKPDWKEEDDSVIGWSVK